MAEQSLLGSQALRLCGLIYNRVVTGMNEGDRNYKTDAWDLGGFRRKQMWEIESVEICRLC